MKLIIHEEFEKDVVNEGRKIRWSGFCLLLT